jgi:hypothetical protein
VSPRPISYRQALSMFRFLENRNMHWVPYTLYAPHLDVEQEWQILREFLDAHHAAEREPYTMTKDEETTGAYLKDGGITVVLSKDKRVMKGVLTSREAKRLALLLIKAAVEAEA